MGFWNLLTASPIHLYAVLASRARACMLHPAPADQMIWLAGQPAGGGIRFGGQPPEFKADLDPSS
jgi:hypothetical protein